MKSLSVERSMAFENLIGEGNFDKLAFFTRSLMNLCNRYEDKIDRDAIIIGDKATQIAILMGALSE